MWKVKTLYFLNSPILTSEGIYVYKKVTTEETKQIIENAINSGAEVISAVGHEATAKIMSEILGYNVQTNRVNIEMQGGEGAIVFKLMTRLPEGKVLGYDEIKNVKYELGFLYKQL